MRTSTNTHTKKDHIYAIEWPRKRKRKLHTLCSLSSVVPRRISVTFNTSKPGHFSRMHGNIYKNTTLSSTQSFHPLNIRSTICYSRRARWPPLSARLRAQNATPVLLHTQIRARDPHRARNVAESAWTPYRSHCLCLRRTNSPAQAAHVSRLLEGTTKMGSVWSGIGWDGSSTVWNDAVYLFIAISVLKCQERANHNSSSAGSFSWYTRT